MPFRQPSTFAFSYSGAQLDKASYQACDPIIVTVTVRNTGAVDADEVVQVLP